MQITRLFRFFLPAILFVLPGMLWSSTSIPDQFQGNLIPEKVNLALRRTVDGLLRALGDSTSRIPAIEQAGMGIWRVRIDQPFLYDQLPALLQSSLDQYDIHQAYQVAVRNCTDDQIDLGYHQFDVLKNNVVPCKGRDFPAGCHYIEITFLDNKLKNAQWANNPWMYLLLFCGLIGLWLFGRYKLNKTTIRTDDDTELLEFGNSRLNVSQQLLLYGNTQQNLTFRETKLLRLFAVSPNQLLERDYILQQVWADEGVLVGRSIDVFISRLRKKLAADQSIGIVAVHGVGYRMETDKIS